MKTLLVLVTVGIFSSLSFGAGSNESMEEAMARVGMDKYNSPALSKICKSEVNKGNNVLDLAAKAKGSNGLKN